MAGVGLALSLTYRLSGYHNLVHVKHQMHVPLPLLVADTAATQAVPSALFLLSTPTVSRVTSRSAFL
jgi:hypothetical protein